MEQIARSATHETWATFLGARMVKNGNYPPPEEDGQSG
jgi:hypothetical protein